MYTLRQVIKKNGLPFQTNNYELGEFYSIYYRGNEDFESYTKGMTEKCKNLVRSVLWGEKSQGWIGIEFSNEENIEYEYYIVGESGRTIEKL